MRKEVKDKWVAALKSGKYAQTQSCLHDEKGFCCLGVLCDLYANETKKAKWGKNTIYGNYRFEIPQKQNVAVHTAYLPVVVAEWAGLELNCTIAGRDDRGTVEVYKGNYLSTLNDEGKSFTEIAKIISKKL